MEFFYYRRVVLVPVHVVDPVRDHQFSVIREQYAGNGVL